MHHISMWRFVHFEVSWEYFIFSQQNLLKLWISDVYLWSIFFKNIFFRRNSHKFIHYLNMDIVYVSYSFIKKIRVLIYNLTREVVNAWKRILSSFSILGLTFSKSKLHQINTSLLLRASPKFTRIEFRPDWWIDHL